MGELFVPGQRPAIPEDMKRLAQERALAGATCPAANIGIYADTGNVRVKCEVESKARGVPVHFSAAEAAPTVIGFCCGLYTECPVWQAEKDDPDLIQRVALAEQRRQAEELTKRQIDSGMRVDDRDRGEDVQKAEAQKLVTRDQERTRAKAREKDVLERKDLE